MRVSGSKQYIRTLEWRASLTARSTMASIRMVYDMAMGFAVIIMETITRGNGKKVKTKIIIIIIIIIIIN